MTYKEVTEYLFSQVPDYEKQGQTGYKPGLDNSLALDEHFGHPHRSFRSIHVGGTNGKGSVSHTIAAQLQVCGYRVGLYTSPHLVDFRERIRVNGQPIPEDEVVDFVEENRDFFESLNPSFFELATAMAFKYFSDTKVDIAIIEVGLGGRLDCTNIITPVLSVITNVSLDHTQLLGNSLEQIAMEKAGIMKPGVTCIIGESLPETKPIFDAIAQETGTPLLYADDPVEIKIAQPLPGFKGMHYVTEHGFEFDGELSGSYQAKNTNTVLYAIHELTKLGYLCLCENPDNLAHIAKEMNSAYMNVCEMTGLKGRWQVVRERPTVVCDTGHNPGAWAYLSRQLEAVECRQMRIVFGMVEDKDVYNVMALLPKKATYFFTKGSTKRAFPETSLKVFGDQFGLKGDSYPTVEEAYQAAMEGATPDDFIFVGGSTYIVADFLKKRI